MLHLSYIDNVIGWGNPIIIIRQATLTHTLKRSCPNIKSFQLRSSTTCSSLSLTPPPAPYTCNTCLRSVSLSLPQYFVPGTRYLASRTTPTTIPHQITSRLIKKKLCLDCTRLPWHASCWLQLRARPGFVVWITTWPSPTNPTAENWG